MAVTFDRHGYTTPDSIAAVDGESLWHNSMEKAAGLCKSLQSHLGADVAQHAVPMAYRIRFCLQLNAREAFHMLELRSGEGDHPSYRRVCQEMHRLIKEKAGYPHIADAMCFVDHAPYDLGRLSSERRVEAKQRKKADESQVEVSPLR